MAGTKTGARKARDTILKRYGDDFYKRNGAIGGANGKGGAFEKDRRLASKAGRKGGLHCKRGKGITAVEVAQMRRLKDKGMTYRDIATELNVHWQTVSRWLSA